MLAGGLPPCEAYGLVPARWTLGSLLFGMFLHDPDHLSHIVGNVACLAFAGFIVERAIGHLAFLVLYLTAGICGGLLHVLVDPNSLEPMVGASARYSAFWPSWAPSGQGCWDSSCGSRS